MKIRSPYTETQIQYKTQQILKAFPILKNSSCNDYISVYQYISHTPERFYNKDIFTLFLDWLNKTDLESRDSLWTYFERHSKSISNAIRNLNQINELNIHDEDIQGKDDYNLLEIIDNSIHPNYLRLVEGVYYPLIHVIAYISRISRNSKVDDLDVFQSVEEIKKQCPELVILTKPYQHIIRNGIAHGGVEYQNNEIKYTDKKGNSELFYYRDIINFFDELLDYCNAMVLALKIFFVMQYKNGYQLPLAFLIDELKAQTENKWLEVNNCISTMIRHNDSQLVIYAFVKTTDILKVKYFLLQTVNLAETLMPGYERYFITFRSNCVYPGCCAFNGVKLAAARLSKNEDFKLFIDAIDESCVLLKSKIKYPAFIYKIDSFIESFAIQFKIRKTELKRLLNNVNIEITNYEIHKNKMHSVINADIVFNSSNKTEVTECIRNYCKTIVRKVYNQRMKRKYCNTIVKLLPLGFARISVYSTLMRKRTYNNYGLGEELICVIQYKKLSRIRCLSIFDAEIETHGLYRIEWNRKWLEINNNT